MTPLQRALKEIEEQTEKYITECPLGHMPYIEISQVKSYLSKLSKNEYVTSEDYSDYLRHCKSEKDRLLNYKANLLRAAAILVRLISETNPHMKD